MDYAGLGSGYSHRSPDDYRGPRTRRRLHQTFHGPGYQHHDQKTYQEIAGCVQFHGPTVQRGLDVHDLRLFGGEHRPLRRQSFRCRRVVARRDAHGGHGG